MERKLKMLFDFQKYHENERLAKMIAKAEQSLECELDDDALSYVSAAGEQGYIPEKEGKNDDI